jgi:hypothetical protein
VTVTCRRTDDIGFAKDDPRTWQPAPPLVELAASGGTFDRWSAERLRKG